MKTEVRSFAGMALVPGIAHGEAFFVKQRWPVAGKRMSGAADIEYEIQEFRGAVAELDAQLLFIKNEVVLEVPRGAFRQRPGGEGR